MNDRLIIIGLCGEARSGKDTVASHLVHEFGFTRIGLADGVRAAFRDLDGPTWERTKELEANDLSVRWALQTLGTECRTDVVDDWEKHWVDHLFIKLCYLYRYHLPRRTRFVVPDVRFPYEADLFRDKIAPIFPDGVFECWRIVRSGAGLAGEVAKHASESSVHAVDCDERFCNDGTIDELHASVTAMAIHLMENS